MSDDGILHFNPWMDFNDGPPSENPFGCDPDPEQIAAREHAPIFEAVMAEHVEVER